LNEKSWYFHIGPVWFDGTVVAMTVLACVLVFLFVFICTRNLKMRPTGKQNVIEWLVDFVRNIVGANVPGNEVNNFHFFAFVLFLFIFISNQLGLITKIVLPGDVSLWKSPTANPIMTLTMALIMLTLTHFYGVERKGFKGYLKSYLHPFAPLLPITLMEEITNMMTLGLRLYGNIYAGEVLVSLLASVLVNVGWLALPFVIILQMIWIAFSIFIGSIQAYVFVTLSMVYMGHKLEVEE
jgi:F-type H+-transporting ATPase subunit a